MLQLSRIGGEFAKDYLSVFQTYNALKDEPNEEKFGVCTVKDAKQAIALAVDAQKVYGKLAPSERRKFIHAIADELETKRTELIDMFCKETNLSEKRGNSELDRTIFQLKNYSDILLQEDWNRPVVSEVNASNMVIETKLHPIGPVAVFGASNFPFAYSTAGGDTASALTAGCCVILKAHPLHAGTSFLVAECIIKACVEHQMPDGVFSHLIDNGYEIGEELLLNEGIKAVGFTGSIKGGRALMDLSAKRQAPIPVFAEMGSVNPVVFFENELEKNLDLWVDKFKNSIATDAGQFCTKPGLLFLPDCEVGQSFQKDLAYELSVMEPQCHLHPTLFSAFKEQVEEAFDWIPTDMAHHSQPVLRMINAGEYLNEYRYHEEFFGPQAIAIIYKDEEELLKMLAKLDGQLTATLIGSDEEIEKHSVIVDALMNKAGRIIVRGVSTGVSVVDAMVHGGTYPAASDSRFTAVGNQSIYRFLRPIAMQRSK